MTLQGKGFFIWQIKNCDKGNPDAIAAAAKAAGLTHILLKIADGAYPVNIDQTTNKDLCPPVVAALKANHIQVWGWHYVYGYPVQEAQIAIKRCQQLGLDGYVIDAEGEYKQPGKDVAARQFMTELRKGIPNLPVALCSYRFPTFHPQLPWKEFLEKCDLNMPQMYWMGAHNPDQQLARCVREFQAMTPFRPVIPVGVTYKSGDWVTTPQDEMLFLNKARELNLSAASFFSWEYARSILKPCWDVIASYNWASGPTTDPVLSLLTALNTHDANKVTALYTNDAVRVTAAQTLQGSEAIRAWWTNFFTATYPAASFTLVSFTGTGNTRSFTWTATSTKGKITNGSDTLGVLDGKITYHYSYYSITT